MRSTTIIIVLLVATALTASAEPPSCPGPLIAPEVRLSPAQAPHDSRSYETDVVALVNQERWDNGQLPPLKHHPLLDDSAETHSDNMAVRDFFAHCDLDTGTLPGNRMTAAGYTWSSAAENIAAGYSTPSAVVNGWMSSPGHRANILSTSRRDIGVGYVYQSGDQGNIRQDPDGDCTAEDPTIGPLYHYWTQNFGAEIGQYPLIIDREASVTTTRTVDIYLYAAPSVTERRCRNEGGSWSDWEAFVSEFSWYLSAGDGTKTVECESRTGTTVYSAEDTILLDAEPAIPGDVNDDGEFDAGDLAAEIAVLDDLAYPVAGDPDCDENSLVQRADIECLNGIIFAP